VGGAAPGRRTEGVEMRNVAICSVLLAWTCLAGGADWAAGVPPSDLDALKRAYERAAVTAGKEAEARARPEGELDLRRIRLARSYRSRLVDMRRCAESADDDDEEAGAAAEITRIDRWLASAESCCTDGKRPVNPEEALPGGLTGGLVLRYTFNAGEKERIRDWATVSSPGINHGGRPVSQGRWGKGHWFDGVDDYVAVPAATSFWHESRLTVSVCVFRHTVEEVDERILARGGLKSRDVWLGVGPDSRVRAGIRHAGASADGLAVDRLVSRAVLPSSRWVHLVLTYDGERMCLYIDGKRDTVRVAPGGVVNSGTPMYLGRSGPGRWRHGFVGVMDDLSVWDRALAEVEVLGLHAWLLGRGKAAGRVATDIER